MKPILYNILLTFLFVFPFALNTVAQWQVCQGLDGGITGNIIQSDSFLITTSEKKVYRTDIGYLSPWEKTTINNTAGSLFKADSCIFSFGMTMQMLKRSLDNGLTWSRVDDFASTNTMCSVDSIIFFCDNVFLYKSYDYLETSEKITILPLERPYIWSINDSLLFINDINAKSMYQSVNSGESWDTITDTGLPSDEIVTYKITYFNNTIWICGYYGVYYLNPDRTSWIEANNGIPEGIHVVEIGQFNSKMYCSVEKIGLFKLNNDNSMWEYVIGSPTTISSINEINNELFCGTSIGPVKMDSVENWHYNFEGIYHREISSISTFNDTIYVCANEELFRSFNHGANFEKVNNVYGRKALVTDSAIYLLSYTDFLISRENGLNWDTLTNGLEKILLSFSVTNEYYLVASDNGLFRSRIDSINWIEMENGLSGYGVYTMGTNDSVVIANDIHAGFFCISTDYGTSFDTLFSSSNYYSPVLNRNNYFYILTSGLVRVSDDLGITWYDIYVDNPYCSPLDIAQNETYFVVAGSHSYLSVSYDYGQTWASLVDNLPLETFASFRNLKFHNQRLFTSSKKNSLWYRDDILTNVPETEINNREKIHIFPNPVINSLTLEILTETKESKYRVFDIRGRKQISGNFTGTTTIINIDKLNPGIYIIEVLTASGKTTGKIIKY